MDKTMSDTAEKLAEHLYGHSREKAIEWAKEDKFDSRYRQAEDIIELLLADGWRQCANGQRTTQFCGQAEASYAKGAEDMRERAALKAGELLSSGFMNAQTQIGYQVGFAIRSLPITPANTEG